MVNPEVENYVQPAPLESGSKCSLSAFVDLKNEKVVLELAVNGTRTFQLCLGLPELALLCSNLVGLGAELRAKRSPPQKPVLVLPPEGSRFNPDPLGKRGKIG